MAKFSPLHTGQFVIKPRPRKRKRIVVIMTAVGIALIPYVTFELGRFVAGYSAAASARARISEWQKIHSLQDANDELQRQLNSSQMGQSIDQQSTVSLQKTLTELQDQLQEQRAELMFYQSIVTPPGGASTEPQVQRVEIETAGAPSRYLLRLVLIQAMRAGGVQPVMGSALIEINGTQAGVPTTLSLQKLTGQAAITELKFDYRYFEAVEQAIELPEDFQPSTVNIELHVAQHTPQRQSFGWQIKTASDATHHVQSS
jgi:hypothetical protein